MSTTIGWDVENNEPISITDTARRSGLYVLGLSGMGKSSLLINIAAQDIKNGHGIFFLDPHGETIKKLKKEVGNSFPSPPIELDPEDRRQCFGINLLACKDISDPFEREWSFTRAYNIFKKVWENNFGTWTTLLHGSGRNPVEAGICGDL